MRFPPQFLDELRARLPVSDVVGRRVRLRKAGREWKGLSPFGKERTPSFTVNDQKGFFHDFSSGKHGDIFGFVMATEGLAFPEAVERLAGLAGVAVPKISKEAEAQEDRRKTLHEVLELAGGRRDDSSHFERGLVIRVTPSGADDREHHPCHNPADGVRVTGLENRRGRLNHVVPSALVKTSAGLMSEYFETPGVEPSFEAVLDAPPLNWFGARVLAQRLI